MRARALLGAVVGGLGLSVLSAVPAPAAQAPGPVWSPPVVVGRDGYAPRVAVNTAGVTVLAWSCDYSICVRRRSPQGALGRTVQVPSTNVISHDVAVADNGTATLVHRVEREDGWVHVAQRLRPSGPVGDPVLLAEQADVVASTVSRTGDLAVEMWDQDRKWLRVLGADGALGPEVPLAAETVVEPAADGGFWLLDRDRAGVLGLRHVLDGTIASEQTVGSSPVAADLAVRTDGTVVVAWWEGPRRERRLRTLQVAPTGTVSRVRGLSGVVRAGRDLDLTALPDGRVLAAFRSRRGGYADVRGGVVPREPGPWLRLGPALLPGYDRVVAVARDRVVLLSLVDTWMDHHVSARTWDGRRVSRPKRIIEAPGYDNDCGSSEITAASAGGHVALVNRRGHSCRPRYDKVVLTYRR